MNLESIIKSAETIGISGHVRPDGDCLGSCLGLWNYIKKWFPDKQVTVYLEPFADKFNFLTGTDCIQHTGKENLICDVFFCLDCGDSDRLGFAGSMFELAKLKCCIDHHISNTTKDENYYVVPTASSTCELVYDLMDNEKLTKEVAECLFLGISHDTGIFQYSNTSPSTMRAAANLLEYDIKGYRIIEDTYYERSLVQNKVLGKALLESQLVFEGKCIVTSISLDEMKELQATSKDLEGVVSQLRDTKGVDVAVYLYELSPGEYKVSLRSNDNLDVSVIAQHFQGGGHKKAAGCTMCGVREEIISELLSHIEKQL